MAYSPQRNGVAKCMLHDKKMQYEFWGEVVNTAVYILNRYPTKAIKNKTSFEVFNGKKPGIKHLKVFGCICYSHIPIQLRQKLDENSVKGIFLGYGKAKKVAA